MGTLEEIQDLEGHEDRAWFVAWSPAGDALASCSGDHTARIWSREPAATKDTSWRCVAVLEGGHTRTVRSCSWSPNGKLLATAGFDRLVAIWELQSGIWEQVAVLEGHESEVKGVAWSPSGTFIATCGRDKTVWVWEAAPGHEYEVVDVKHGHSQDVKCVRWHPSSELLVSVSYDDSIKLWRECDDEWICVQTLIGEESGAHASTVWDVAFAPGSQGSLLASCSDDSTIKFWRLERRVGEEPRLVLLTTLSGYHERTVFSIDWSTSRYVATGSADNSIRIFKVDDIDSPASEGLSISCSLECRKEEAHPLSDVNCVRWHPTDPTLLASAGDDGHIKLWRLRPGDS